MWVWASGRGLSGAARSGLHQTGGVGDEKEEREVAGDAKTRLDAIVEAVWGDAVTEAACARRVSRARMAEDERAATMVQADSDDDMDDPRDSDRGPDREEEERGEQESCGNLPTKPGPFTGANSKAGAKPSMAPGANE